MSDVNIKTSWDAIPSSDAEYNTVLGCAGYDQDNERLFISAQQVPNIATNITTAYARGFRITSGYDGIVLHDAITEQSAQLKTVKFTMSTAGTGYDLTDARCYVQFENHYTSDISSWALQHIADDETVTTVASGSTIAADDRLQVDFKNDYGAGRFVLTLTYADAPVISGGYKVSAHSSIFCNNGYFENLSDVDIWITPSIYNNQQFNLWLYDIDPATYTGDLYRYQNGSGAGNYIYYSWDNFRAAQQTYNGQYYNLGNPSSSQYCNVGLFLRNAGYTMYSNEDAPSAFYDGIVPGGINTASLSNYTGNMWQCRMIANVAAISPGPMATESEGGTEGDFDITSDQITAPGIPSTYTQSYFGHIYLIDSGNLAAVASIINSNDFIDQFYTNFGDIAKCIVSISQFPISTYSGAGTLGDITVGSKRIASSSLTPQAKPLSRFAQVDCGSVNLHLFWDSALDLNPYTKLNVYIPCVGMRPLDADVVMGHTLGLYYNVDFMTGNALAILTLDGDYYDQYSCTLATQYALNTEQWGPVYQGIMSTLSTAAIGVAVSGSGGAMAGALAGAATQSVAQKLHHDKAGTMGASMSLFSQMQPFVEILRPIQQLPRDYTKFNAYPSYMTTQLFNLSGYVEVQDIRLDDIDCTDAERSELMSMLQSGVIL